MITENGDIDYETTFEKVEPACLPETGHPSGLPWENPGEDLLEGETNICPGDIRKFFKDAC